MEVEVMQGLPLRARLCRVAAGMCLGLIVSWLGKSVLRPRLSVYLSVRDPIEALHRFQWVMNAVGLGLIPFALYFSWFGLRIIKSGQYPYPGATVWRDTVVVRGRQASRRGLTMFLFALALLGLAAYAAILPTLVAKRRAAHTTLLLHVRPPIPAQPIAGERRAS